MFEHALDTLRRAAERGYPWSIYPAEATALVAEVERLRAIVADQQMMLDEHRMDNQHAYEEGGHAERAAVVAALRRTSNRGPMGLSLVNLDSIADAIERGEHRREEESK